MHFRSLRQCNLSHASLQWFISYGHQDESRRKCSNGRHVVISHVAQKVKGKKKRQSYPCNRTWRPICLWEIEAPTFSRQLDHRWRCGQTYGPVAVYPPRRFPVLISLRGWVDPRAIFLLEALGQLKNPITSSGLEPACSIMPQPTTLPRAPVAQKIPEQKYTSFEVALASVPPHVFGSPLFCCYWLKDIKIVRLWKDVQRHNTFTTFRGHWWTRKNFKKGGGRYDAPCLLYGLIHFPKTGK
jgi:hypothetical protein